MEYYFTYNSDIYGECASDYDLEEINCPIEKKFIQWVQLFEDTLTKVFIEIELYESINKEILLEKNSFTNYPLFLSMTISNICYFLIIEIDNLFGKSNSLNFRKFISFCIKNNDLLFINPVLPILKAKKEILNSIESWHKMKIKDLRCKIYAHYDEEKLDRTYTKSLMEDLSIGEIKKYIIHLSEILNDIWKCYKGNKLCFESREKININNIIDKISVL